jgi:hypothetical protein
MSQNGKRATAASVMAPWHGRLRQRAPSPNSMCQGVFARSKPLRPSGGSGIRQSCRRLFGRESIRTVVCRSQNSPSKVASGGYPIFAAANVGRQSRDQVCLGSDARQAGDARKSRPGTPPGQPAPQQTPTLRQGLERKPSQAWATKMLTLTMANNAVTISIITTVLTPRGNETASPAEQSKEFNQPRLLRTATDDFRQQRMSER